jgi:hypothetical protein
MTQQVIKVGASGADSRRVLEALTPLNGVTAPTVNASFLGQIYINTAKGEVHQAVAVGSTIAANDWQKLSNVTAISPLSGSVAPTVNASYFGQMYIDTVAKKVYVAVAVGSATPANDWQAQTAAV